LSGMVLRTLCAVALLVAGCSTPPWPNPEASSPEPSEPTLVAANLEQIDGTWQLLNGSVDGRAVPMPAKTRTTIAFIGAEFGGQAACNSYGGRLQFVGNAVAIGEITQTLIGCAGEVGDSEQTFMAGLRAVTAIWLDGDHLVLTGPRVQLRFTQLPEVRPDEFVDRLWVLDALVHDGHAAAPAGLPATLLIGSDGTFSGSTGCRTFRGEWMASGDQIRITAIDMGGEQCPQLLKAQDDHVVGVVGSASIPTVEGDELTLRDVSGDALIYRAAAD
jgi:heat shock protein HslJ